MTTSYFTFGQLHVHNNGCVILDKDCVVKITADDPRAEMFRQFGNQWSMQYDEMTPEILQHFPRGIIEL